MAFHPTFKVNIARTIKILTALILVVYIQASAEDVTEFPGSKQKRPLGSPAAPPRHPLQDGRKTKIDTPPKGDNSSSKPGWTAQKGNMSPFPRQWRKENPEGGLRKKPGKPPN
jgi:hypothetical protein